MTNYVPLPSFPGEPSDASAERGTSEYASWIRRAAAYLLDGVLITALAVIIAAATHHHELFNTFKFHLASGKQRLLPIGSELDFFVGTEVVIQVLYTALLATTWQATLGMRALGIFIATEADHSKVGLIRAEGRTVVVLVVAQVLKFVLSLIATLVVFLDVLWPLWDARNQTLHDKVAKTVVLRQVSGR
jgi:uncharacterized RDD family membrane protein YckC